MKTRNLTLAAMATALSVALLFVAGLVPGGSLALTALAALLPTAAILRGGLKWGALTWAAVSILSFVLITNKVVAILYTLVLGHYGIWKSLVERIGKLPLEWACKLLIFNALTAALYLIFRDAFDTLTAFLSSSAVLVFAVLNVAFVIYDLGCSKLIAMYAHRIGRHMT